MTEERGPPGERGTEGGTSGTGAATEEELRQRLEEELRKLRVEDVLLQSVVSLINLSGRRIAKQDERDLDQARVGIEAVRAVVDLLDPDPAKQVRSALSELQMLYAKHAGAQPEAAAGERAGEGPGPEPGAAEGEPPREPGPGLWTPPGST